MSTFVNNMTLYIKRAELHHNKEYIINACHNCRYGKVNDLKFIEKEDNNGRKYNGVILIFETLYDSSTMKQLQSDMSNSKDGSGKMFHDPIKMRFWHVIVFKPRLLEDEQFISNGIKSLTLSAETSANKPNQTPEEKIAELEAKLSTMSSKMTYMELQMEKAERRMMEYEENKLRDYYNTVVLQSELEDANLEIYHLETNINKLNNINEILTIKCNKLEEEVGDADCVSKYLEKELNNMRIMLKKAQPKYYEELY